MQHLLITPETCPCDKQSDISCNVCDGGLAICSRCGKAEAELDGPCVTKHRYSHSQLQTYIACPLKYRLRYIEQLVPLAGDREEHDLRYGRAIDAALNTYYACNYSVVGAQKAFALSYPASEYPATLPYWSPGKSFQNGLNAIAAYTEHWQDDDQHWEVIGVQSSQRLEEDSDSDRLVRIDLVIRDRRDGLIYGVDHKATGKYLDKDFNAKFDPHSQIRQYVDRLQRKYGQVGGFYINALSFKHRTKAYTPRSGPDKGIQLPAGDWYAFKRLIFNPNAEAISAERENFDGWVAKIESDRASGTWGYNTEHCVRGPFICEYHQICSAGYSWPRDSELITNYYRQQCIRLAGNGERCQLEPGHEGDHDPTKRVQPEFEIEMDEIEEAEQ